MSIRNCIHFVELVGPGGTGKSSVTNVLRDVHGCAILRVGTRPTWRIRFRSLAATLKMSWKFGLNASEALSLFRKCTIVEHGIECYEGISRSLTVVDEGPIRTLRDTRCSSYRERRAWWAYAKSIIAALQQSNRRVIAVEIKLDESARKLRVASRSGARTFLDRLADRGSARRIPTLRFGISTFVTTRRVVAAASDTTAMVAEKVSAACLR